MDKIAPFKSKAQQRFMFARHPEMAKRWAKETPSIKKLPEKKAMLIEKLARKKKERLEPVLQPTPVIFGMEGPNKEYARGVALYNRKFSPPLIPTKARIKIKADKALDKSMRQARNPFQAFGAVEGRRMMLPLSDEQVKIRRELVKKDVRKDLITSRRIQKPGKLEKQEFKIGLMSLGAGAVTVALAEALKERTPGEIDNFAKFVLDKYKPGPTGISKGPLHAGLSRELREQIIIDPDSRWWKWLFGGPHYNPYSKSIQTSPNMGILAHELGHARNAKWVSKKFGTPGFIAHQLAYMSLSDIPQLGKKIPPPLGAIPVLGLVALPFLSKDFTEMMKGEDKDSLRYKVFDKVEKYPEVLGGALMFPKLLEEGVATGRGLGMVFQYGKKMGGVSRGLREIGKMIASTVPAYSTYVLGAALPLAIMHAVGKARRKGEIDKQMALLEKHEENGRESLLDRLVADL